MLGIKTFAAGAVVGAGVVMFAHHYHVVHSVDGVVVVPRVQTALLRSTYADIRGWDAERWAQYPELAESLKQDGRAALMRPSDSGGERNATSIPSFSNPASEREERSADQPPIVFGATASVAPRASAPLSAEDDSLLGRLARQLQGTAAREEDLKYRPLLREPAPQTGSESPVQPAQAAPPKGVGDRAAAPVRSLSDDVIPSIHSAALQRISSELAPHAKPADRTRSELPEQLRPAPEASAATDVAAVEVSGAAASASPASSGDDREASTRPADWFDAAATSLAPLDIDRARLEQRIPSALQESLRSLRPTNEASPPPGAKPL